MSPSADNVTVPETVFAYRHRGDTTWRIKSWECDAAQLAEEIAFTKWDLDELRIIREFRVHPGLLGLFLQHAAIDAHWLWAPEPEGWYPMEQELPPAPGNPSGLEISFNLQSADGVFVEIGITAGDVNLALRLDTTHHRIADLARFADLIEAGHAAHVCFQGNESIIDDVMVLCTWDTGAGRLRLRVRHTPVAGDSAIIDVEVARDRLVALLRDILEQIGGDHCREPAPRAIPKWAEGAETKCALNERESERQGWFSRIGIRLRGHEGWFIDTFVRNVDDHLAELATEGHVVEEWCLISRDLWRPVHNGFMRIATTQNDDQPPWRMDEYWKCWRAPEEEFRAPPGTPVPTSDLVVVVEPPLNGKIRILITKEQSIFEVLTTEYSDPFPRIVEWLHGIADGRTGQVMISNDNFEWLLLAYPSGDQVRLLFGKPGSEAPHIDFNIEINTRSLVRAFVVGIKELLANPAYDRAEWSDFTLGEALEQIAGEMPTLEELATWPASRITDWIWNLIPTHENIYPGETDAERWTQAIDHIHGGNDDVDYVTVPHYRHSVPAEFDVWPLGRRLNHIEELMSARSGISAWWGKDIASFDLSKLERWLNLC